MRAKIRPQIFRIAHIFIRLFLSCAYLRKDGNTNLCNPLRTQIAVFRIVPIQMYKIQMYFVTEVLFRLGLSIFRLVWTNDLESL